MEEYDIKEHTRRFAAWAASRATSRAGAIGGASFGAEDVKNWIETTASLRNCVCSPERLPEPDEFNGVHEQWRNTIIGASGLPISHGIAAKIINVYLKVAVVQCSFADLPKVKAVHPPIDRLLLEELKRTHNAIWRGQQVSWSKFDSDEYQRVITKVRETLGDGVALWKIEQHWQGHR